MHISYVCSSMMTVSAKFTLHTVCIVENGTYVPSVETVHCCMHTVLIVIRYEV